MIKEKLITISYVDLNETGRLGGKMDDRFFVRGPLKFPFAVIKKITRRDVVSEIWNI